MVLAGKEVGLAPIGRRIGLIDADKVKVLVEVGHHPIDAGEDLLQQLCGIFSPVIRIHYPVSFAQEELGISWMEPKAQESENL